MNGSNLQQYLVKTILVYVKQHYEKPLEQLYRLKNVVSQYHYLDFTFCEGCDCAIAISDQNESVSCKILDCGQIVSCNSKICGS